MDKKISYHKNAQFRIEGDTLIIRIMLDKQKVKVSRFLSPPPHFIASVIKTLPTPFGRMVVNVTTRLLT